MKATVLLLTTLFFMACLSATANAGSIRIGDTRARKIAKDPRVPGKFVDGQCLPFAIALHKKFEESGIPSKILVFQYQTLSALPDLFSGQHAVPAPGDSGGSAGSHAVVVYNDDGRTYAMDNQSWQPTWIHEDSPAATAGRLGGMRVLIDAAYFVRSGAH